MYCGKVVEQFAVDEAEAAADLLGEAAFGEALTYHQRVIHRSVLTAPQCRKIEQSKTA